MVCLSVFPLPSTRLIIHATVFPLPVRFFAGHGWCPRCQVGSQRDCHDRALLHSTRRHPTDWRSWSPPDCRRTSHHYNNVTWTETHWCAFRQFLAVHTFVAVLWQVGLHARGVALGMVCLDCVFITLWVAIGAGVHKNYETPTPVRYTIPFFSTVFSLLILLGVSIGAGSVLSSRAYALAANTSGCGSH